MTEINRDTGTGKIKPKEVLPIISNVDAANSKIKQLYLAAALPFGFEVIMKYARYLNISLITDRAPWVYKLLEMDYSLGPGGYGLQFDLDTNPKTYGFFQLRKYDAIYRPMKYVYMPFGMTSCPAGFSRDIAQNACAHIEKCVLNLLNVRRLEIHPKATLGTMTSKYPNEFDSNTLKLINSVNSLIYGRTKHKFDVELPRLQLLSLAESLAVYFVCRVLGLRLLQQAGTLSDIVDEIKRGESQQGIYIGMKWFI